MSAAASSSSEAQGGPLPVFGSIEWISAPTVAGADIGELKADFQRAAVSVALEEDIVFGRLMPRERLIEEELAERFNVKRHILRAALDELDRLGLIQRVRFRGAIVRLYARDEVEGINAVREMVESEAARQIPLPLADSHIAELTRIQEIHDSASRSGDLRLIFRSNIAFHKTLFSHCPNASLIEVIDLFAHKSHAYRSIFTDKTEYLTWAVQAHWNMIDAIRDADGKRLTQLCREHLAPAKNLYIETYGARPHPA